MNNVLDNFSIMTGFINTVWPLSSSIKQIIEKFAYANGLLVSMMNASIWNDSYQNVAQCIQVTFYEDNGNHHLKDVIGIPCIYPMFKKAIDRFDPININGYANSIEEYFKICSQECSVLFYASLDAMSGKIFSNEILNADNALVELELASIA